MTDRTMTGVGQHRAHKAGSRAEMPGENTPPPKKNKKKTKVLCILRRAAAERTFSNTTQQIRNQVLVLKYFSTAMYVHVSMAFLPFRLACVAILP